MYCIMLVSVAFLALQDCSTFSHKQHDSQKNKLNIKCVLWFSLLLLSEAFLILRRTELEMIIYIYIYTHIGLHVKYRLFLSDINETWNLTGFRKICSKKFNKNPFSGSPAVPCARTDRHDEANSCFSQFFECAWKQKNETTTYWPKNTHTDFFKTLMWCKFLPSNIWNQNIRI